MRLLEFLNFANSNDSDWPSHSIWMLCFTNSEKYEKEGLTHGLESHAIKHLQEFDPQFANSIYEKMIEMFLEYKGNIYGIQLKNKPILLNDKELKQNLTNNIMQNILDFVNDKIYTNSKLIGLEPKFKEFIKLLTKKYENILNTKVSNSIDLTQNTDEKFIQNTLRSKKIIKFDGIAKSEYYAQKDNLFYFDLKDNTLIVYRNGQFHTMFRKKSSNAFLDFISKYTLTNPVLNKVLYGKE